MLRLGILGYPLHHTLSPLLHETLMNALGVHGKYCVYETAPDALAERLAALEAEGCRGLNVTIPHKVAVMEHLDRIDTPAMLIGAVNTVVFSPEGRTGYNTDVTGFLNSLPGHVRSRLPQTRALVLGAGGSARAVLAGLIQSRVQGITLAVRSPDKAQETLALAERLKEHAGAETSLGLVPLDALNAHTLADYSLVVNTTPVGMAPQVDASPLGLVLLNALPPGAFVYDLIYRPLETRLIQACRAQGIAAQGGLEMLICQGTAAFTHWTGMAVPAFVAVHARKLLSEAAA